MDCAPLESLNNCPSSTRGNVAFLQAIERWMESKKQSPFDWQLQAWSAHASAHHGLILASTGMGKTKAAWLGPLGNWLEDPLPESLWTQRKRQPPAPPLLALWITPLRALANDTCLALQECIDGLNLPWSLEQRTGDTSSATKLRQRQSPPTAMVITPESLTLLLSYPESLETFKHLRTVIVDEWHELLGSKRGIQTELALARLQRIAPNMLRWGLSATIGNTEHALASLVGSVPTRPCSIIRSDQRRAMELEILLPKSIDRFPWAGHIGLAMLSNVIEKIEAANSTLVFTNTRNQTELWYQSLLRARPDWAGRIAVHHGSLAPELRTWVEQAIVDGKLIAVVCTSSLDLGVDFAPVDQVIQVGSPKGTARLIQRAGRSGHSPGRTSKLAFVPAHAFEIIELQAARDAIQNQQIEQRRAIDAPLDCLVQHAVTVALCEPYTKPQFLDEVRSSWAYRNLADEHLDWVLEFVTTGGCLHAYPDFHRVALEAGTYSVRDAAIARRHRMAIGTITSDMMIHVQYISGGKIGFVEESFAAKLKQGDKFLLGGKLLEMEWIREGTVWVRKAKGDPTAVPRWLGGNMPLSSELAEGVRRLIDQIASEQPVSPCLESLSELMRLQKRWSHIPRLDEVLVERCTNRDGDSIMLYAFEGRSVSEGIGALLAYRISQAHGNTLSIAVNDYGVMLYCAEPMKIELASLPQWLDLTNLETDILASLNATELTRRRFRDIARIAGLIHSGTPGKSKSMRQLQASTSMVFDALKQYDAQNLLLWQASDEVLADQLQIERLKGALRRMQANRWVYRVVNQWTPFSFPLMVERIRDRIGNESLADRIRKMQNQLEKAAVEPATTPTIPTPSKRAAQRKPKPSEDSEA
ncbi:MAG: ligase-associated DNA damage response DEXH box helicase [Planctomycetota bacterium]|nr:ligase-associated DNA damage response DEXH box helicase [Planctomycetota bacterium]